MFFGTISAIAFGAALPLLLVLWGETMDNFIVYDQADGSGNSYSLVDDTMDLVYYYICTTIEIFYSSYLICSTFSGTCLGLS